MNKSSEYYNILAKRSDRNEIERYKCACDCKCRDVAIKKAVEEMESEQSKDMAAKVILGIVGISVLAFVIVLCIIIRSEAPYYGWRRYYW